MFSGKTSELIRRCRRFRAARKRVLLAKPAMDTRYSLGSTGSAAAATHDGERLPAVSAASLAAVERSAGFAAADVIGVDEAQFFPDAARRCEAWAAAPHHKTVVVAALSGTFRRQAFPCAADADTHHTMPVVSALLPLADTIQHLTAVCGRCCRDGAAFSWRNAAAAAPNASPPGGAAAAAADAPEEDVVAVGGAETYVALCRGCWARAQTAEDGPPVKP